MAVAVILRVVFAIGVANEVVLELTGVTTKSMAGCEVRLHLFSTRPSLHGYLTKEKLNDEHTLTTRNSKLKIY